MYMLRIFLHFNMCWLYFQLSACNTNKIMLHALLYLILAEIVNN